MGPICHNVQLNGPLYQFSYMWVPTVIIMINCKAPGVLCFLKQVGPTPKYSVCLTVNLHVGPTCKFSLLPLIFSSLQIGRASCRERVSQQV